MFVSILLASLSAVLWSSAEASWLLPNHRVAAALVSSENKHSPDGWFTTMRGGSTGKAFLAVANIMYCLPVPHD
jgi:hypothetical protein